MTFDEWRSACPLRKWIANNGGHGAITKLAAALGVSRAALDTWTRGRQPRVRHLQRLEAETGIAVSSWMRWLMKKPAEPAEPDEAASQQ